jgi:ABC-type transport system involved in cytochrome bd biosynthesis fused ATPase/permease subunit
MINQKKMTFDEKINKFAQTWGILLVVLFFPESFKLWIYQHTPNFLSAFLIQCAVSIPIHMVVIVIPLKWISYLKKKNAKSSL